MKQVESKVEVVGLRAKLYNYRTDEYEDKKCTVME